MFRTEDPAERAVQMMMDIIGESKSHAQSCLEIIAGCGTSPEAIVCMSLQIWRKDSKRQSIPPQLLQVQPCWMQCQEDC